MDYLKKSSSISVSTIFKLSLILLCLLLVVVYFWKKRWLYYYSSILPGPFSLPFLGTVRVAFAGQKNIFPLFENLVKTCPLVWRVWIGNQLYVVTSRPNDIDKLLNNFLSKENILLYDFNEENLSSLFTSRVSVWKIHRKMINPSFNQQIINSFTGIFVKYANVLNEGFEQNCGKGSVDVLTMVWRCTLDTLFETLANVDPKLLRKGNDKFVCMILRYERLLTERFFNVIYHFTFFWKLSVLHKEVTQIVNDMFDHIKQLIDLHMKTKFSSIDSSSVIDAEVCNNNDNLKEKAFLNHLLTKELTAKEVLEETTFMFMAGSETTALTISSVLLVLSIYPEIQETIYEEQCSIFADIDKDATLDDINQMNYLERVIKETMRFLPPAPYLARDIEETTELNSHVYPAGSAALIPVWYVHKYPEFWPNPLKFDPDRFLPEEIEKRPRAAYLPFSYGYRNCIGLKYGMMSMKAILSTILRRFKIKPGKYKSIEEIEVEFHFVGKSKDGYKVAVEKRGN
ncbi:hypothetical protein Zmor_011711 [Zophobas morio]|uniref:Cytochrome P450 n=1 Tax=Zophobas morio TaxID=2755281 RepID=A0AA38ITJ1_9CUCU|nr:hypothetical protein Zmor_011711 [Zophobas morio]